MMIGPFVFHLYGFIVGIAIVTVYQIFQWIMKREQFVFPTNQFALLIGFFALIGARLYHVVTDSALYISLPWWSVFQVWNGGIGMIGALLGGATAIVLFHLWYRKPPLFFLFDTLAISIPFGQSIGRWGNLVNHELYGKVTALPWGITVPKEFLPIGLAESTRFHPLFLYESVLTFCLGLVLLSSYMRKYREIGSGFFIGLYCLGYGSIRFALEFLRFETARATNWLSVFSIAQWWMIVLICIGIGILWNAHQQKS